MKAERRRALAFSAAGLALALGALAALNVVSRFVYLRLDLSAGRAYSISPGTKAVLGRLKDTVVIRAYFTRHLPQPYGLTEQYLRDLLAEYRSFGGGRVKVEFVDPDAGESQKAQAQQAGVAPVQVNVVSRDKFEVKEAYMGVVFLYRGKTSVLGVIEDEGGLEHALTRQLKKLSDPVRKTVGFVSGHGEKTPEDRELEPIFSLMRDQNETRTVSLDHPLPPELDALWVLAPVSPLKSAELEALKAWVARGKTLGLILGRRRVQFETFQTFPVKTGLEELLKGWGLEVREGLVVDAHCERIRMQTRYGAFTALSVVEYPYLPVSKRLNRSHPATQALEAVTLPLAHPLAHSGAGGKYSSLADSSELSWYQTSSFVAPSQPLEKLAVGERGPFSLAGVLEVGQAKVIVVASPELLNMRLGVKPSNAAFFLNLVDWSFQDQDLLSIRAKGLAYRPLRRLSDAERFLVKQILILFLPAALLAAGFAAYRRQRVLRQALMAEYGEAPIPEAAAAGRDA